MAIATLTNDQWYYDDQLLCNQWPNYWYYDQYGIVRDVSQCVIVWYDINVLMKREMTNINE